MSEALIGIINAYACHDHAKSIMPIKKSIIKKKTLDSARSVLQ